LRPGSVVAVIGVGGLGSFAVQLLRELSAADVVALDTRISRVDRARSLGAAHAWVDDGAFVAGVREASQGRGADAVLDFVGNTDTMQTALRVAGCHGTVIVVGVGGGQPAIRRGELPFECELLFTRAGTPADLSAVVKLAEQGRISVEAEWYGLAAAADAYDALRSGRLNGRAVVTPGPVPG
jgi:propanol-preferring alcohol dehydrogenase